MKPLLLSLAAASLTVVAAFAADGILVVQKTTTGTGTQMREVHIEGQRMRAEMNGAGGAAQWIVFDGAKQTLVIVNDARKTYSEMTKADADRLGGQLSDAMTRMQEQLKNMPPEQRAQAEAMLRGRGLSAAVADAPKTTYRKTGSDTVGKWPCDKYEGYQGDKKVSEVCAAEPKTVGFTAADFKVTKDLVEFFGRLMPQTGEGLFAMGSPEQQGYSGIPIRHVSFVGDQRITRELVEVKRQAFPSSTFEVPAGYTKEAGNFGGRGRGF